MKWYLRNQGLGHSRILQKISSKYYRDAYAMLDYCNLFAVTFKTEITLFAKPQSKKIITSSIISSTGIWKNRYTVIKVGIWYFYSSFYITKEWESRVQSLKSWLPVYSWTSSMTCKEKNQYFSNHQFIFQESQEIHVFVFSLLLF